MKVQSLASDSQYIVMQARVIDENTIHFQIFAPAAPGANRPYGFAVDVPANATGSQIQYLKHIIDQLQFAQSTGKPYDDAIQATPTNDDVSQILAKGAPDSENYTEFDGEDIVEYLDIDFDESEGYKDG